MTNSSSRSGKDAQADLLERLRVLPAHLAGAIKGQDHVLDRVCSVLMRGELGLSHPQRPRGSFLMVGPTGVGKTETTNVFTSFLFGRESPVRFDMSEYQLQTSVDKLIGCGLSDRGLLGRVMQDRDRGTVLFDEIEKAHPLVLDLFLQILEDARITVATGEALDFSNFYIVFTSNIGSSESMRMESAPFASVERTVLMRVREALRPELVARISEVLVFARLAYATQRTIAEAMVAREVERMRNLGFQLSLTATDLETLIRNGYDRALGVRPMRAVIERGIQNVIVNEVLTGSRRNGTTRDASAVS